MAKFIYKELQSNGKQIEGEIEARDKSDVEKTIRDRGGIPINIEPIKQSSGLKKILTTEIGGNKIKLTEIAIFSKQMSTMISSGMTLVRSLDVVSEQSNNKKLRVIAREMSLEIQKGNTLSGVMKNYPNMFPKFMLNMIESGELTGQIDVVFENLNTHYTKEAKINKKIKGAMIYPIVLFFVAIGILALVFEFVIPAFIDLYEGQELPALTQGLISTSEFFSSYWIFVLAMFVAMIYGLNRVLKTKKGKLTFDKIVRVIPFIQKMVNIIVTSRFTRTLGTLLSGGISIISSLTTAAELTNNQILIERMEYVVDEIKKGRTLGVLLKEINYFPPMMVSMISIGEESGDIDGMLSKTADYYDDELEATITTMLNLIEPVMLVIMGSVIGVMVIAIMLPLLNMYGDFTNI